MSEIVNDVSGSQDQVASQDQVVADQNASAEGDVQKGEGTQSEPGREVAEPGKKVQTPEENHVMREMRLKMEALEAQTQQAQRDAMYSKKYPDLEFSSEAELKALYGDQGISSYEDLDSYYDNLRKAEELETSPQMLKELNDLKNKVNFLTTENEKLSNVKQVEAIKQELSGQYGEIYKNNENDILTLAEKMGMMNASGIKAATATILADKLPDFIKDFDSKISKAKEEAVKEYVEKKQSEIPTEGSGTPPASVGKTSNDSWKTARQSAIEALRGNR